METRIDFVLYWYTRTIEARRGPRPCWLGRGQAVLDENRRLAEAFPGGAALTQSECPSDLAVHRMSWTNLSTGMSRDNWINQLGTEEFDDQPGVYGAARYTNNPSARMTQELGEAVALRENATHVRVARITELVVGLRARNDTFTPGSATAWVVTLSRETLEVTCAQRIHAENADWVDADGIERQVEGFIRTRVRELR